MIHEPVFGISPRCKPLTKSLTIVFSPVQSVKGSRKSTGQHGELSANFLEIVARDLAAFFAGSCTATRGLHMQTFVVMRDWLITQVDLFRKHVWAGRIIKTFVAKILLTN